MHTNLSDESSPMLINDQSIKRWFDEHYEHLVSYSSKLLDDPDERRDAVQLVFINLFEKKSQLKIQSIKAYLYKAVHNQCLQILRSKKENTPLESTEVSLANDDWIEQAEREAEIWRAIDNLPDRCREVFVLNRFEDHTNDEIAKNLNLSKRTVETQISEALKRLRKALLFFL